MSIKRIVLIIVCTLLLIASVSIIVLFKDKNDRPNNDGYQDGIEYISPDTIELSHTGALVKIYNVILSRPRETRKLIVFEQDATESYTIEKSKIRGLDWEPIKQDITVSYSAKGLFVVDLDADSLKMANIKDDPQNKVLTLMIKHPYLEAIEIDPNKIIVVEQKNGFFAFGKLALPVEEYVSVEKELQKRFKAKLDTSANGQEADRTAKEKVKEIYEPVVKAVDPEYSVEVEFAEEDDDE